MRVRAVYIQQDRGIFCAPCALSLYEGARFLGAGLQLFEEHELEYLPLTRETLVHGWVRTVQAALRQVGVPVPPPLDYPEELRAHLAAPVVLSTLGALRAQWAGEPPLGVFIKPVEQKLFTGHTIERFSDLAETATLPEETPIWTAGLVRFETEYRVFVHEHRIRGIKHYRGDPWRTPDKSTVVQMVRDHSRSAPIAYGLDVGVTEDGRTCLVEVNDCYSLGNYGFDPIGYTEMVEDRWLEMVGAR